MADKKDNDEYEFSDFDEYNPQDLDEEEEETYTKPEPSADIEKDPGKKNIQRNALIVIVLVVLAALLYKCTGAYFSKQKEVVKAPAVVKAPQVPVATVKQAPIVTEPVASKVPEELPLMKQKIEAMELTQQNMRTELTTMSNQLNSMNTNVNALNDKITSLNQTLASLASTIEQQSAKIAVLTAPKIVRPRPPRMKKILIRSEPLLNFYIQAVIPGRAWLIASNGSTLTVRVGSIISGYGMVKMIDAVQGRVLLSSGRVIRFAQNDS